MIRAKWVQKVEQLRLTAYNLFSFAKRLYSLVYLIIPLVGFFFQPVIGVLSDRCQSRFGPRRPFILVLSIASLIGLLFILNGSEIGSLLSNYGTPDTNGGYGQGSNVRGFA